VTTNDHDRVRFGTIIAGSFIVFAVIYAALWTVETIAAAMTNIGAIALAYVLLAAVIAVVSREMLK
jgi:hypothetical protein